MKYWQSGEVITVLLVLCLLLGVGLAARLTPRLRRLGLPLAIVAGLLGLVLGDQALGLFSLDRPLLEAVVYHGLAIVFIAVGLVAPSTGGRTAGSRAMAFAIVAMMSTQAIIGLTAVLLLGPSIHPGFGLLLPMGFEEGPGQALAMGASWEGTGLHQGAQVGLIIAVLGYAWSIALGIPLVLWGRRKGWTQPELAVDRDSAAAGASAGAELEGPVLEGPVLEGPALGPDQGGGLDRLTQQVTVVGGCYLLTWAVCAGLSALLSGLLPGMPDLATMVWGFHFIFGAAVAMAVRPLLGRVPGGSPIDDPSMRRVAGLTVDVITAAALAAVQLTVLRAHWLPIVLVTTLGGLWTLLFSVWIARRAWVEAPFEHAVLWFGMSTGTLPTGLALLKVIDPELRSPAAVSAVFGSAGAILGAGPLLMGLVPMTIAAFGPSWPARGWLMLLALCAYALVVMVLWRLVGGLRLHRPLWSLWPDPVPRP